MILFNALSIYCFSIPGPLSSTIISYIDKFPNFCFPSITAVSYTHLISDNNIAKAIADKCGCEYFHYRGETTYTFFHKKASKLDAIKHMADYLDISLKDICAFGDDINDIEMIEHCGYGVAMANALDIICLLYTSHQSVNCNFCRSFC